MPAERALLLSTVAVFLIWTQTGTAWAAGGAGGQSSGAFGDAAGGAGGTGVSGAPGAPGSGATVGYGGGGGGGAPGGFGGAYAGGGIGGGGNGGVGGAGGANGISMTPGSTNSAVVNGGGGGAGSYNGNNGSGGGGGGGGGFAAIGTGAGSFINTGTLHGGQGGSGGNSGDAGGGGGNGGDGGFGFLGTSSGTTLTNAGPIIGGNGGTGGAGSQGASGGLGGTGVFLGAGSTFRNTGSVGGGTGGTGGYGFNGSSNGPTGIGGGGLVVGSGSTVVNEATGSITGGAAGSAGRPSGSYGSIGVGGVAVTLGSGSSLTNHNLITGGAGGSTGYRRLAGTAGIAVVATDATITNHAGGQIRGGAGATGSYLGFGGVGGVAIGASHSTIINNTGASVIGGNGGAASPDGGDPGFGADGITGSDLAITNKGSIVGGHDDNGGAGQLHFAIVLTGGTNTVGGTGTINGGVDVEGGSFQPSVPRSTVGTPLNITGPLIFASDSKYVVRITPTATDRTIVDGIATLNGATVFVEAGNGIYTEGKRKILTASALDGSFAGVTTDLAFLKPTVENDAENNSVILTISAGTADALTTSTIETTVDGKTVFIPNYRIVAFTGDEAGIAAGLTDGAIADGGTGKILTAVDQLTAPQARAAFDSLSGEGIAATQEIAHRSSELFTTSLFDQTTFYGSNPNGTGNSITLTDPLPAFSAYAPTRNSPIHELADLPSASHQPVMPVAPSRTWRAWGSGFGGYETVHGDAGAGSATQSDTIYGGVVGVDYQVTPNYLLGVAVGGSDGFFSVPGRTTSGETTGGHIAIYDLATFGAFYGASSNAFSYYTNRTTRSIAGFGGLASETERGTFDSHEFRSRLEFGRHVDGYGGSITPFVALEIANLRSNGFNETAISGPGLLGLNVSGQSTASVPSFVGARFQRVTPLGNGMVLSPTLEVSYLHEFAPLRAQTGAFVNLPSSTFIVDGAQPGRNAARVKAGGELALSATSVLFANFDGEFSGTSQFYAGQGGFRYLW